MSSHLRHCLRKEPTPPTLIATDSSRPPVVGMCTARSSNAEHNAIFTVLDHCPYEQILGNDFPSSYSAFVDCAAGLLQLPLLQDAADKTLAHLCSVEFIRPVPKAASAYVILPPAPRAPDGDYVLSPTLDVILTSNVALPDAAVTVADNRGYVPLLNSGIIPQALTQGIRLACVSALKEHA